MTYQLYIAQNKRKIDILRSKNDDLKRLDDSFNHRMEMMQNEEEIADIEGKIATFQTQIKQDPLYKTLLHENHPLSTVFYLVVLIKEYWGNERLCKKHQLHVSDIIPCLKCMEMKKKQ